MGCPVQAADHFSFADAQEKTDSAIYRGFLDLLWVLLAVFVLPNLLVLGLFGRSPEFFRGWFNVELAASFAVLLAFRRPWIALPILALELTTDLIEPVAHVFYFCADDAIDALQYLGIVPPLRLVLYGCSLLGYLTVVLFSLSYLARRVCHPRLWAVLTITTVAGFCVSQLASGRYATLFHHDTRSSTTLLIRTPVASLVARSWPKSGSPKPQEIDSTFHHLPPGVEQAIIRNRVNVVSVLVESWGLLQNAPSRDAMFLPFSALDIEARYEVQRGSVPFVGATIFGESRSLCGEIFGTALQNIDPVRLGQCYPAEFARNGYTTVALHGFYSHMYARDQWMPKVGFQSEIFEPQMKRLGMRTCEGGLVGTCDSDIAEFIHRRLSQNTGRPEFIHWMTLDSHLPIRLTPENLALKNCSSAPELTGDDALCVWYSMIFRVNEEIAAMARDTSLSNTVFIIEGDHAPPFFKPGRRRRFSQTQVPYVMLIPRSIAQNN